MQENQSREQYFFEDETLEWFGEISSQVERVGAVFMPSLLRFPNVWVFDADERFQGAERYSLIDVTKHVPDLDRFGLVLMDPPFLLSQYHMGRLLAAARGRPLIISASDWCVAGFGWGKLFSAHGLTQVTTHFPRYRSIGNGYCEDTIKRDGRTNISFFSNISFAPPRRPVVLSREMGRVTFDPYDFHECAAGEIPDRPPGSPTIAKSIEIAHRWVTPQGRVNGLECSRAGTSAGLRARLARWYRRLRHFPAGQS